MAGRGGDGEAERWKRGKGSEAMTVRRHNSAIRTAIHSKYIISTTQNIMQPTFPGNYRLISLQRKSNLPAGESNQGAFERIGNEDREWRRGDSYNEEYRGSEEKRGPKLAAQ